MIFEYRCSGVGLPGAWVSLTLRGGGEGGEGTGGLWGGWGPVRGRLDGVGIGQGETSWWRCPGCGCKFGSEAQDG